MSESAAYGQYIIGIKCIYTLSIYAIDSKNAIIIKK